MSCYQCNCSPKGTNTCRCYCWYSKSIRIKLVKIFPTIPLAADFDNTPIRITILPGDTDVTVSIPIVNDTIVEEEESFDVVLEASGIGVSVGNPRQAEVTIAGKKSKIIMDCNSGSYNPPNTVFGLELTPL